jgi:allantoate deiminase
MGFLAMTRPPPSLDASVSMGEAISTRLASLEALSDEDGSLTRLYLSPAHRKAADLIIRWMREAGMSARIDSVGNVVGRYEAEPPHGKTLILGSHIDTVRQAGSYDGNLGVVTAIEIVDCLRKEGRRLAFAVEVVAFGDEEGVRFPSTLGGSRALAGLFDETTLEERDVEGISRREALLAFGCDPTRIAAEARLPEDVIGYVEVHIEQGPVLESENRPVGVVTAISGASRGEVRIVGESAHAGATPMPLRRDALAAAAVMILAIEQRAQSEPDLVATVGRLEIANPAVNTVPGAAPFTLDVRAPDDAVRKAAVRDIMNSVAEVGRLRGVRAEVEMGYEAPSSPSDPALSDGLAKSIERLGLTARRLPSGAGHDAMAFRGRIPFAMLFVRCRGGVSHNPTEYAAPADIEMGARVLLEFVRHLAPPSPRGD